MTVLRSLPRWLQRLLLAVNAAGSAAVLAVWWPAVWPNIAAAWAGASWTAVPLARAARAVLGRIEAHHRETRAQIARQASVQADAHSQSLAALSDQVAALHAKLDQQQGGGT